MRRRVVLVLVFCLLGSLTASGDVIRILSLKTSDIAY